ncbi:uncharacterized protein ATNIH1004_009214 [Aspergillus tanneri]|uniref:Uncharacterized protein n=1 Tax=Aspergillus tanneri TaxID=1220188 RepID=A0A5M9MJ67_9EURO|nr:uncharacterized protein ATNIH1004_009214 [Aspergillus tanneri]KAA8645003.1 hypothetical protein ATNIH1004_009214 [Aspergillus tanneri]
MAKTGYCYTWYSVGALSNRSVASLYTVDERSYDAKIYSFTIILDESQAGGDPLLHRLHDRRPDAGIVFGTGISGALFVNFAQQAVQKVFTLASEDEISNAISGVESQLLSSASGEHYSHATHGITRCCWHIFIR